MEPIGHYGIMVAIKIILLFSGSIFAVLVM
jgi:hypothetical protein